MRFHAFSMRFHAFRAVFEAFWARWIHIRRAKELAGHRLAIIGNGDVFDRRDAMRMLRDTGCDGVPGRRFRPIF